MKRNLISGFSLIELLVVVAVLGLLAALVVPAFNNVASGTNVSRAGQSVSDQLMYARQIAAAKNVSVDLRLIQQTSTEASGKTPGYFAMQIWEYNQAGTTAKPLRRLERLPEGTIVNPQLSPLLEVTRAVESGTATFGSLGNRNYKSIRIRPNGRMEADVDLASCVLTAQMTNDDRSAPANYYTVQINPLTGRLSYYRP